MPVGTQPPRLAERLMGRVLHSAAQKNGVVGDLREEYARRCARRNRFACDIWFWRQAILVYWRFRSEPRPAASLRRRSLAARLAGDLLLDTRFAARSLRKRPLFTAVAVVTLGVGIGATTAIYSVAEGVLLRPLPFERPGELVQVWRTSPERRNDPMVGHRWRRSWHSYADYERWREVQMVFQDISIYRVHHLTITGLGPPREIPVAAASSSLFSILRVTPILGRTFLPGEDGRSASRVALLSFHTWREHFGEDPAAVGASVQLNNRTFTVVGVLPPEFRLRSVGGFVKEDRQDMWIPVGTQLSDLNPGNYPFEALARLAPRVSVQQAEAAAEALLCADRVPSTCGANLLSRAEAETGSARSPILVLLGASFLLLLIGCGNVAVLLMGEFSRRRQEVASRVALGAGASRVVRQLLTESMLLGTVGGGLGIVLCAAGTKFLVAMAPAFPRLDNISMNASVLVCAVGLGLITGLLFGIVPALDTARTDLGGAFRGVMGTANRRQSVIQRSAIALEVAMTMVLLVSGTLLARTLGSLLAVDLGFQPRGLVEVDVLLSQHRFPDYAQHNEVLLRMRDALASVPGVSRASATSAPPFSMRGSFSELAIAGRESADGERRPLVSSEAVMPGYFATMGIPLLAGRAILESDRAGAPNVSVINQAAAAQFWPDKSPLGSRVSTVGDTFTVVGIVGDVLTQQLRAGSRPAFYLAAQQEPEQRMGFVVRVARDPLAMIPALRDAVWSVDPSAPIINAAPVVDLMVDSLAQERFRSLLFAVFGFTGILLAGVGVFGVTVRQVAQRSGEIGIRIALGARTGRLMGEVVRGVVPAGVFGLTVGTVGALLASRLLSEFLFGVTPWDPLTYLAAFVFVLLAISIASYVPARRVNRVDPVEVLRAE